MKGIIVASHGDLARGMENTLSMFFGEMEQISFLSLASDEDLETFLSRMTEAAAKVDSGDGTIIFTDMFGGTPNNCACRLLEKYDVVSGFNLPMLMTVLTKRLSGPINILTLIEDCKSSFVYVNEINQDIKEDEF